MPPSRLRSASQPTSRSNQPQFIPVERTISSQDNPSNNSAPSNWSVNQQRSFERVRSMRQEQAAPVGISLRQRIYLAGIREEYMASPLFRNRSSTPSTWSYIPGCRSRSVSSDSNASRVNNAPAEFLQERANIIRERYPNQERERSHTPSQSTQDSGYISGKSTQ